MRHRFPTHAERRGKLHDVIILTGATCRTCQGPLFHSPAPADDDHVGWHADFCPTCDRWMEIHCWDRACDMCLARPERPSRVDSPMRVLNRGQLD